MLIRAKPETIVVNIEDLICLLRSKDTEIYEQSRWLFDSEPKFLDS